jgi:hypothetical protein
MFHPGDSIFIRGNALPHAVESREKAMRGRVGQLLQCFEIGGMRLWRVSVRGIGEATLFEDEFEQLMADTGD